MSFTLDLSDEQLALREKTHAFAREVVRPVASPIRPGAGVPLAGAGRGRPPRALWLGAVCAVVDGSDGSVAADPDGEAVLGVRRGRALDRVPALALAAIRQAATDEQLARWAPECCGTPGDIKLAAPVLTEPSALRAQASTEPLDQRMQTPR